MSRDLYITFLEEGESVKGIVPGRRYYLWEVDELKQAIDADITDKNLEHVKKGFELYMDGELALKGMFIFGSMVELTVLDYVKRLVDASAGTKDAKMTFHQSLESKFENEISMLKTPYFKKFVDTCEQEISDHEFSLDQLYKLFEFLESLYSSANEIDKMVEYLNKCIGVYQFNDRDFTCFFNFFKNYFESIKQEEYRSICMAEPQYSSFIELLSSPLIKNPQEGFELTDQINTEIRDEIIRQLQKPDNPITKRDGIQSIAKDQVEKAIIKWSKEAELDNDIIKKLEDIIGYRLIAQDEENEFNIENELIFSEEASESEKVTDYNLDKKEEISHDNQQKVETMLKLYQEGKIKDPLNLTDDDKLLIEKELNVQTGLLDKETLEAIYKENGLNPGLISILHGEKTKYRIVEEVELLENISNGDLSNVFPEDENSGRRIASYEMFKNEIHQFLLEYDESIVNKQLRLAILEKNDLALFKKWSIAVYAIKYSEIICKALRTKI